MATFRKVAPSEVFCSHSRRHRDISLALSGEDCGPHRVVHIGLIPQQLPLCGASSDFGERVGRVSQLSPRMQIRERHPPSPGTSGHPPTSERTGEPPSARDSQSAGMQGARIAESCRAIATQQTARPYVVGKSVERAYVDCAREDRVNERK